MSVGAATAGEAASSTAAAKMRGVMMKPLVQRRRHIGSHRSRVLTSIALGGRKPRGVARHATSSEDIDGRSRLRSGTLAARRVGMRLVLLAALGLVACHDRPSDPAKPPTSQHGAGRDRWRGGGVYVDGAPVGVLRYAELPRGLQPVWETHRRVL